MSELKQVHAEPSWEEQYQVRLQKVQNLQAANGQAWPEMQPVTATAQQLLANYNENDEAEYRMAGRLLALRWHGKTAFATLQDRSGRMQIYLKQDALGLERFVWLNEMLDLGDYVWVRGTTFMTKTGEVTLRAEQVELLSKCLHPLPEKFHGLTDTEIKYRQRYLDLISNPEVRERFLKRSKIISFIRKFLEEREFVEVETPMLHPIPGGAIAKPFVTHHNALNDEFYLRIAPELYLKRLVVGGMERVFEINRNFRNEGVSTRHNPEFTMLEFYMAHQDYHYGMQMVEELLHKLAFEICGETKLTYGDHEIDFGKPFARLSTKDAILQYTNLSATDLQAATIDQTLQKFGVEADASLSLEHKLYLFFDEVVEAKLIQPTFLIDFPIEVSPLSRRDAKNPELAARFELFIGGMELANAFNELNDPFDQAERFKNQAAARGGGDEEAHYYDADYIRALEYGLPPALGVGIGIDRLTMLLTNTTSIRDVILFPTLKKKH